MGFPIPYAGVFPKLLLTAAISMAAIRDACTSLLESLGITIIRHNSSDAFDQQNFAAHNDLRYLNPQLHATGDHPHLLLCRSAFAEAVQSSLPAVCFDKLSTRRLLRLAQAVAERSSSCTAAEEKLKVLGAAAPLPGQGIDYTMTYNQRAECTVCLCEFESAHEVRELPSCSHIFHKECIDAWLLRNHRTCPLCRSSLLTPELIARQERLHEQELSDQLASWFAGLQEEQEISVYHDHLHYHQGFH